MYLITKQETEALKYSDVLWDLLDINLCWLRSIHGSRKRCMTLRQVELGAEKVILEN
jgi:hypothetical protein